MRSSGRSTSLCIGKFPTRPGDSFPLPSSLRLPVLWLSEDTRSIWTTTETIGEGHDPIIDRRRRSLAGRARERCSRGGDRVAADQLPGDRLPQHTPSADVRLNVNSLANEVVGMDRTDALSSVPQTQPKPDRAASTEAERAGTSGTADRGRAGSRHRDEEPRLALALDRMSDGRELEARFARG